MKDLKLRSETEILKEEENKGAKQNIKDDERGKEYKEKNTGMKNNSKMRSDRLIRTRERTGIYKGIWIKEKKETDVKRIINERIYWKEESEEERTYKRYSKGFESIKRIMELRGTKR